MTTKTTQVGTATPTTKEVSGGRLTVFRDLPKDTRFRFKNGKVWYRALKGDRYRSENSGAEFCSDSQKGGWYTNSPNVTLVVKVAAEPNDS